MGDKIEADDKKAIEEGIEKVKAALSGTDTEAIKDALSELEKVFHAVSEKLYQPHAGGGEPGPGEYAEHGGQPEGDFVDADYEIVEDVDDDEQENK
jgi:molecular chaperone DnaK